MYLKSLLCSALLITMLIPAQSQADGRDTVYITGGGTETVTIQGRNKKVIILPEDGGQFALPDKYKAPSKYTRPNAYPLPDKYKAPADYELPEVFQVPDKYKD